MRKIAVFVSGLVFSLVCLINGANPNFVRSVLYNVNGVSNNVTSTEYSDGLLRTIQSKLHLSNGKARVVSSFIDNAGRPYLTTRPYIDLAANPVTLFTPGDFNSINGILDNAENYGSFKGAGTTAYAYSETEYYDDPLGRVKRAGAPGIDHRLESDHFSSSWTFGVTTDVVASPVPYSFNIDIVRSGVTTSVNVAVTVNGGFICSINSKATGATESEILDGFYSHLLENPIPGCDHFLIVTRDPAGTLTQEIKDRFGRTDSTRSVNGAQSIIAKYQYDELGNVLTETAPKNGTTTLVGDCRYTYNTTGQLLSKTTPDGGTFGYAYTRTGQLSSDTSYDEGSSTIYRIRRYQYDDLDRLEATELKNDNDLSHDDWTAVVKNYYDNTEKLELNALTYNIPQWVLLSLENIHGRLAASIAINSSNDINYYVCDIFTYSSEGRISKKYKIVPGITMQQIVYGYDLHGKILTDTTQCGGEIIIKNYQYDEDGQLKTIVHTNNSGKILATYNYTDHGQLDLKELATDPGHQVTYGYTIRDWVTTIASSATSPNSNNFVQTINQYSANGNILNSAYNYQHYDGGLVNKAYSLTYAYDQVNRLTSVVQADSIHFNTSYSYDEAGRFKTKVESGTTAKPGYKYYGETSRLKNTQNDNSIYDYYYDKNGNLILDKSKKMVIEYDWRDMPVIFRFYNEWPSNAPAFDNNKGTLTTTARSYFEKEGKLLLSQVVMLYDASGNRVLKMGSR